MTEQTQKRRREEGLRCPPGTRCLDFGSKRPKPTPEFDHKPSLLHPQENKPNEEPGKDSGFKIILNGLGEISFKNPKNKSMGYVAFAQLDSQPLHIEPNSTITTQKKTKDEYQFHFRTYNKDPQTGGKGALLDGGYFVFEGKYLKSMVLTRRDGVDLAKAEVKYLSEDRRKSR